MNSFIRGNRDLIKAMNRNLLLNIIRREGQISRKQLTDISGLSVGAVSGIVTELLENNWILEIGEGDYTGGRRQTLIKLNPDAGYAVGVKLMENRVVVAITNFESKIVHYQEAALAFETDLPIFVHKLAAIIRTVVADSPIEASALFGVGIGLAGAVDSNNGVVRYSPFFGWRNIPLAALLEDAIQLPVTIENDVNTLTLTEQLFGAGLHHDNFIVMTMGRGIGMGLVINQQLYRGARGGAGELGHTILMQANGTHQAADFLTLEALSADPAVTAATDSHTLAETVALAEAGDEAARQALFHSGTRLGAGLANIINILNPELVIISGEGLAAGDYRLEPMLATMRRHTFDGLAEDVEVVIVPTDDRAWARGAASLVISKVFESPIVEARIGE